MPQLQEGYGSRMAAEFRFRLVHERRFLNSIRYLLAILPSTTLAITSLSQSLKGFVHGISKVRFLISRKSLIRRETEGIGVIDWIVVNVAIEIHAIIKAAGVFAKESSDILIIVSGAVV
jgi:hypothetical protein